MLRSAYRCEDGLLCEGIILLTSVGRYPLVSYVGSALAGGTALYSPLLADVGSLVKAWARGLGSFVAVSACARALGHCLPPEASIYPGKGYVNVGFRNKKRLFRRFSSRCCRSVTQFVADWSICDDIRNFRAGLRKVTNLPTNCYDIRRRQRDSFILNRNTLHHGYRYC